MSDFGHRAVGIALAVVIFAGWCFLAALTFPFGLLTLFGDES